MGANKTALGNNSPGQDHRHCCDNCKVPHFSTYESFARWVRVIGENHVWKYPDKVADLTSLANVNITVEADVIANLAMPLNIG